MKCADCHTENKTSSSFCENCGAPLELSMESDVSRTITFFIVIAMLLIMVAGYFYFFHGIIFPEYEMTGKVTSVYRDRYEKARQEKQKEPEAGPKTAVKGLAAKGGKQETAARTVEKPREGMGGTGDVTAGWVTITDSRGRQVNKFRAGLTGIGWLALPARACIGGNRWYFHPDSGTPAKISGGLWINGDKVGLWRLAEETGGPFGPGLASWDDKEPVSWISLESDKKYQSIKLSPDLDAGYFITSVLPEQVDEIGIFVQKDKVVGWSFGELLVKAYMWPGKTGTELGYDTWVRYFYDITFANGREEKFAMAMQDEIPDLNRLAFFIEGFKLQPKLAIEDTPYYLLPGEIIKHMRVLVADAVNRGKQMEIVNIFSGQMLRNIGNIGLLMDVVPAIAVVRGFESAIGEIEESGRYIVRQMGHSVPALDELHLKLYQEWLRSLVSAGMVGQGLQGYNAAKASYPDDPYIHLLGVELQLLNGNWDEAERLLYMRNYPADLQDRYQILAGRISEMKGEEGKIIIRFPPGASRISVTAIINGALYQDFVVDTGASMVSIPSSIADELGLDIQGQHTVSTVGGVITAGEVIIDAIEIDGWVEYDVRALVVDIPDRPGLGLLGLSYLGRFRMDLKTDEGTLLLGPR